MMHLLLPLLLSPLAALTFALPGITLSRNKNSLQTRDDSWSHGIPANGVTCATPNEPAHILQSSDITAAITAGGGNVYTMNRFSSQNVFWPKEWSTGSVGTDHAGHAYTIKWAAGCDPTQQLYYIPIGYPGFNIPAYSGSSLPALVEPAAPASPVSSDVVLFTVSLPNAQMTTPLDHQFCAVLTNSDTGSAGQLYPPGALSANALPVGYHQCNPN